jgi:hypothetical protein
MHCMQWIRLHVHIALGDEAARTPRRTMRFRMEVEEMGGGPPWSPAEGSPA